MRIFDIIYVPMGWMLAKFNLLFGNYAYAIIAFTLVINIILIPTIIFQQKSMAKQHRLKPKLAALKIKHGDDKQAYNKGMQELYAQEKANPLLGCLPLILTMPFLFGMIAVIYGPLTYIANLSEEQVNYAKQVAIDNNWVANQSENTTVKNVREIYFINHWDEIEPIMEQKFTSPEDIEKLRSVDTLLDFQVGPFNLSEEPNFSINVVQDFEIIWLIPITAFLAQLIMSILTQKVNKRNSPEAPRMAALMYIMPIFSLFFAFNVPAAVGFYWIFSSLFGSGIRILLSMKYSPQAVSAATEMDIILKRREKEKLIINQFNG